MPGGADLPYCKARRKPNRPCRAPPARVDFSPPPLNYTTNSLPLALSPQALNGAGTALIRQFVEGGGSYLVRTAARRRPPPRHRFVVQPTAALTSAPPPLRRRRRPRGSARALTSPARSATLRGATRSSRYRLPTLSYSFHRRLRQSLRFAPFCLAALIGRRSCVALAKSARSRPDRSAQLRRSCGDRRRDNALPVCVFRVLVFRCKGNESSRSFRGPRSGRWFQASTTQRRRAGRRACSSPPPSSAERDAVCTPLLSSHQTYTLLTPSCRCLAFSSPGGRSRVRSELRRRQRHSLPAAARAIPRWRRKRRRYGG